MAYFVYSTSLNAVNNTRRFCCLAQSVYGGIAFQRPAFRCHIPAHHQHRGSSQPASTDHARPRTRILALRVVEQTGFSPLIKSNRRLNSQICQPCFDSTGRRLRPRTWRVKRAASASAILDAPTAAGTSTLPVNTQLQVNLQRVRSSMDIGGEICRWRHWVRKRHTLRAGANYVSANQPVAAGRRS